MCDCLSEDVYAVMVLNLYLKLSLYVLLNGYFGTSSIIVFISTIAGLAQINILFKSFVCYLL